MRKTGRFGRRVLWAVLSAAVVLSAGGCAGSSMQGSVDLMKGSTSSPGNVSLPGSVSSTENVPSAEDAHPSMENASAAEHAHDSGDAEGLPGQAGREAVIVFGPDSPELGGTGVPADSGALYDLLEQLEYSPVTCDGLPEWRITFSESGASRESVRYDVNLTEGWVWRNRDTEAKLSGASAEAVREILADAVSVNGGGKDAYASDSISDAGETGGNVETDDSVRQTSDRAALAADFGVRLLRQCREAADGNILLSPLSVLSALGMTANGAGGRTLAQMEEVLGWSLPELNAYLAAYREALPEGKKCRLHMANAIWFKDTEGFSPKQDFLRVNEEFYQAGLYKAPFDGSTAEDINGWVEEHTDGMIGKILDNIPPSGVMYLVNALAFEAEWENVYQENQMRKGVFTKEDGTCQDVTLMYSSEHRYLESERAEGFLKDYADGKYAFAALLPKEGVSVGEYVDSLTGEELYEMLENPAEVKVNVAIPVYKAEYSIELGRVLAELGMPDAFDAERADFSGIGVSQEGNLYISRVLHKTYLELDGKGTKAGAATAVEMRNGSAMMPQEEVKTVYLDRPFVYLIIDCEEKLPVFIGIVTCV